MNGEKSQPKAIIIEDQTNLAELFRDVMSEVGYEPVVCQDGRQGLEVLQASEPPHLILLDLNLPYISGREVLAHIRADGKFAETKVIIITADARGADSLRQAGDYVLDKPVSFDQLAALSVRLAPTGFE